MSGFLVRLALWMKLWRASLPAGILMVLFPAAAYAMYRFMPYRIESFTSLFYEKTAMLLFLFLLQWCFAIDFDSKFAGHLLMYPMARWRLLMERALLASILFAVLLGLTTLGLTPFAGGFVWKGMLFSVPVYIGMTGVFVLATVIGNHSLGGLCSGLVFWFLSLSGVFRSAEPWILYNRLGYAGAGILLSGAAVLLFNRRSG
ncbi:hypothetical protein KP806_22805 [Paenibacillus sp. N4]|uniref:hypothetical protein n=1 Tax=Paenibacillus vietnamensis TaxID=2590547 RepID=UPI001CD07A7A|nr:hypothetical protein [Paenibacillus vietnamensis]MCA0757895.1 hypothetical protein [Paenibacillus vietnamensis]